MRNVRTIIVFMIVSLTLISTSCSKAAKAAKEDNEALSSTFSQLTKELIKPEDGKTQEREEQANITDTAQEKPTQNETIVSFSPDGKYRAEAYGRIDGITAGGLFPYEGIRILSVDNGDVIWEMEGGYTVSFTWSPDSRYAGIYHTGRTWGESVVIDVKDKKAISLPGLDGVASRYDVCAMPQEDRPDPYFEICGWEDSETIIVNFRWTKIDGEEFNGKYAFNVKTNEMFYR